jgi:GNAT superfamily N-acetyltransferase
METTTSAVQMGYPTITKVIGNLTLAMSLSFVIVDYHNPTHGQHLLDMLDQYARDPMGGNQPLDATVKQRLIHELQRQPQALSVLAYSDERPSPPIALANCFMCFSTFKAKPLINIHDCVVAKAVRGQGVGQALLAYIEQIAVERGCCKITLEVLEGNKGAQAAYRKFGFKAYELDDAAGQALFWEKAL